MHPIIIDAATGMQLWRATDCATHCGVSPSTWRSYSRAGGKMNPPSPATYLDRRTPLWNPDEVRSWHAGRPGSPVPNNPSGHTRPRA